MYFGGFCPPVNALGSFVFGVSFSDVGLQVDDDAVGTGEISGQDVEKETLISRALDIAFTPQAR